MIKGAYLEDGKLVFMKYDTCRLADFKEWLTRFRTENPQIINDVIAASVMVNRYQKDKQNEQ